MHSVERLNTVIETLNSELGHLEEYRHDIDRAHAVWNGVNKKLDTAFGGGLVPAVAEPTRVTAVAPATTDVATGGRLA